MSDNPVPADRYRFTLEGSGLGETTYRVSGAGDLTRLRVRYEATEWQRVNVHSCSDEEWQRDVVGAINLLVDASGGRPVPQDMVSAFNAWRMEAYNLLRRKVNAQPDAYGEVECRKTRLSGRLPRSAGRGIASGGTSPVPIAGSTAAWGWAGN